MVCFIFVFLIGVFIDVGVGYCGVWLGLEVLCVVGLLEVLEVCGVDVCDVGNLDGLCNFWIVLVEGYCYLDEVVVWNYVLMEVSYVEFQVGCMLIMFGGDYCLGIGLIIVVVWWCCEQGKNLCVLWLDVYLDFNISDVILLGNIYGMLVVCLCGFGLEVLIYLVGSVLVIILVQMYQIGICLVDLEEKCLIKIYKVDVYDMCYIDENGMKCVVEVVLVGIDENIYLYVSFDVDFFDLSIVLGVGIIVLGGVNYCEVQLVMEMIVDIGCMGLLDIVEFNFLLDKQNVIVELVVDLVESLFGKFILMCD